MSKIYASMDELVKEFIDKATNKQCGENTSHNTVRRFDAC